MSRYLRARGVLAEVVDEQVMLVDHRATELITLNRVGSLVWVALDEDESVSLQGLVARVVAEYPDEPREVVIADVGRFVDELVDVGVAVAVD